MKVGLIGLGLMGSAMGSNLLRAGFDVIGYDVESERREEHVSRGGTDAGSPAEVARAGKVVVLSLPNSDIGRSVCFDRDGVEAGGPELVIDTTTARPSDTTAIGERFISSGIGFVDATMSGNAAQAADRDIVAMVGGDPEHVERAWPVLEAVARSVHHVGPVGSGAVTKLIVNQILGVHRIALAEGLVMGERAGVDLGRLLDVLKDGAAYSKAMDIWGTRMVEGDHFPPASRIRQSHKDFRLILDQGQQLGSPTWLASTVRQLLGTAEATGLGDADNSAVVEILRRQAGIGRV
ncbi:MAG: NAD(P)-dependent oxidoreductase [Acidimicrobiia bacterium]|nr:NAD(P)-dependent oxidoreductase [Acidimicrobiia bacterium]MDH4305970.1 NAD(P)-dependent oxidoreductase [Acidimicrobiia bacterium]MDH5294045.1 NAD(P)-dependent oxidoreductase [Acidimicrobiia bacterium]